MRSENERAFYFHAAASTLGGFLEEPFPRAIPSQASVSLPSVGGEATVRTGAFNFEEIVSCRAAYTRVFGRLTRDGSRTMTVTAVVEGLNILHTFTADRLVVQATVDYPREGGPLRISLAGSSFEGLRIGGCDATPTLNHSLLGGATTLIEHSTFRQAGGEQADRWIECIDKQGKPDDFQWLRERFGWMASKNSLGDDRCVLASLVNGIDRAVPGQTFGHAVLIPNFGSVFLGEVFVCPASVEVYSFRAELGCGIAGKASGPSAEVRGHPYP